MKYIFMRRDELGDEIRAHGTPFLEAEHEFPNFDRDDECMYDAFLTWKQSMNEKANKEWSSKFGPESTIFIEELYR